MKRFNPLVSSASPETANAVEQQPDKPNPCEPSTSCVALSTFDRVTLLSNPRKKGLQLHFPGKPADKIRDELKAAGWRWSFRNTCWYHKHTPENFTWAQLFVLRHGTPAPSVSPITQSRPAIAAADMKALRPFIGTVQMQCLADGCRGGEKDFFFAKLRELAERVATMPSTYGQEGKVTIAYLHFPD